MLNKNMQILNPYSGKVCKIQVICNIADECKINSSILTKSYTNGQIDIDANGSLLEWRVIYQIDDNQMVITDNKCNEYPTNIKEFLEYAKVVIGSDIKYTAKYNPNMLSLKLQEYKGLYFAHKERGGYYELVSIFGNRGISIELRNIANPKEEECKLRHTFLQFTRQFIQVKLDQSIVPKSETTYLPKMRIWHIPQVGAEVPTFYIPVENPKEASKILDVIWDYDLFQYENKIKPDYCNTSGLQVYDGSEWEEWDGEIDGNYYEEIDAYISFLREQ